MKGIQGVQSRVGMRGLLPQDRLAALHPAIPQIAALVQLPQICVAPSLSPKVSFAPLSLLSPIFTACS